MMLRFLSNRKKDAALSRVATTTSFFDFSTVFLSYNGSSKPSQPGGLGQIFGDAI
jgi:hypothetical protein